MQIEKTDVKKIKYLIKKNYLAELELKKYNFFTDKAGRIFLTSKHIPKKLSGHALGFGLHFGSLRKGEKIQLTIEGSQLVGPSAKKNVAVLEDREIFRFIEGLPVKKFKPIDCELKNFILITDGRDFFGSGILREGYIESLVPKGRRVMTSLKKV